MPELYIGLISGTSMDGVDAVLVDLETRDPTLLASHGEPLDPPLRRRVAQLADPSWHGNLEEVGRTDAELGELFAKAALHLLETAGIPPSAVRAIGSHGQTVRHRPSEAPPFTLQIGDPSRIAELTGITTVADFRRRDVAAGGQGAPLVPAFHAAVLRTRAEDRAVLNLGGIANLTLLWADPERPVTGFDTGPANTLLDRWANRHLGAPFDASGAWAMTGRADPTLLARLMADPYFHRPPPKSTGPEHFGLPWLESPLREFPQTTPADVQATLVALTAESVAAALMAQAPDCLRVVVCGGGVHNEALMRELARAMPGRTVESSAQHGLHPDWVEGMAFAWLAQRALRNEAGNLPAVTGAKGPRILGAIYPA